jgi:preprotein translocase subunit SecA
LHFEAAEPLAIEELSERLLEIFRESLKEKTVLLGEDIAPQIERFIALQSIDKRWKEHLYEMDGLREGIGYQAYAQKDPLIEYKFQAFTLFHELIKNINTDIIRNIFRVHVVAPGMKRRQIWHINRVQHEDYGQFGARGPAQGPARGPALGQPYRGAYDETAGPQGISGLGGVTGASSGSPRRERLQVVAAEKVGRNDPCPCGSGKKYKYCCGR